MIQASDTEFHPRDPNDRIWTETTYLAFNVPEAALHGTLYVLARPNLGVAMSSVVIARGMCRHAWQVPFCDPQIHLPCPPSYSDFSLANGLSVKAVSLTDWRFQYTHQLGACSFDLSLKGLHRPFDPTDTRENPVATTAHLHKDPRVGDAWSHGHFDLKGHITGRITLRGETYDVDCYEGMDRSWGPRNETPDRATSYISVNCGAAMSMWLTMTLDVAPDGHVRYEKLNSGFLVEHGEVTPVVSAQVEATTVDMLAVSDRIVVNDAKGREHVFHGAAIGTRPMGSINPSISAFVSLMRYQYNGLIGHGGHGKLFGLNYLAQRLARKAP